MLNNETWNQLGFNAVPPDVSFTLIDKNVRSNTAYYYPAGKSKHRSSGSIQTIGHMNDLLSKVLEVVDPSILFEPDFPVALLSDSTNGSIPEHIRGDLINTDTKVSSVQTNPKIISWGVVRKEAGTLDGKPFSGTQEIKPRPRELIAIFDENASKYFNDREGVIEVNGRVAKLVQVHGQFFDNLVQYNIWSRSNREAEDMVEWFEELMLTYTGLFREAGIVQMWFDRRVRDVTLVQNIKGYQVRSVLYYIRTERISLNTGSPIKRIDLGVHGPDLRSRLQSLDLTSNTMDNYYSKIVDDWVNKNRIIEELNNVG